MKYALSVLVLFVCIQPALAKDPKEVSLDEADRLKVQLQIALEENAELRKRAVALELQAAQTNLESVKSGGSELLRIIAKKYDVDLANYELRITEQGEIRFVRKIGATK